MNKDRRKRIEALVTTFQQVMAEMENVVSEADGIRDEEQDAFGNMPESLQNSDRGQAAEAAIDNLDTLCLAIDTAVESMQEAIESAERAQE
jgi:uncharacterized coiled-coil DUF342 family protein